MTRINVLENRFLYVAHDRCMMASHFDRLIRLRVVIVVRRGGNQSICMTRKVSPRIVIEN